MTSGPGENLPKPPFEPAPAGPDPAKPNSAEQAQAGAESAEAEQAQSDPTKGEGLADSSERYQAIDAIMRRRAQVVAEVISREDIRRAAIEAANPEASRVVMIPRTSGVSGVI